MTGSVDTHALTQLAARLKEDARVGRLKLPTLPDVAYRIREVLDDEEAGANRIARLVQLEPSLTARLLQVANSARYLGSRRVDNVRDAITRLGIPAVRNLATALSLHSRFRSKDPRISAYLAELWGESCRVGAIANVLAAITPGLQPDKAMLAGLVHDIGSVTLVPYLNDFPDLLDDRDALDLALGRLRARLGTRLLQTWGFDEALVAVPAEADNWLRDAPGAIDYADLVIVARVHALFGRRKGGAMLQSLRGMPAFLKFPISQFGPDASIQLIEEAQGEIATMMHLLRG